MQSLLNVPAEVVSANINAAVAKAAAKKRRIWRISRRITGLNATEMSGMLLFRQVRTGQSQSTGIHGMRIHLRM